MTQGKLIYVDKNKVFHATGIFGYDIRNNWIDYIYLINDSVDAIKCITENGERTIPKDSLCVISFQNVKEIYNHVKEPFKMEFNERRLNNIGNSKEE